MDSTARKAANLNVLKRQDADITDILDSASFVVIYRFDDATQAWAKKGVEGTMFIFRRSKIPLYGFFVMNRLGIENFTMSLEDPGDVQITPEYIILRNKDNGEVYGIWVYENEDRERMGRKIMECCHFAVEGMSQPIPRPQQQPPSGQGPPQFAGHSIDVATLFAQASPAKPQTQNQKPPAMNGDVAGQSLLAMLRKNEKPPTPIAGQRYPSPHSPLPHSPMQSHRPPSHGPPGPPGPFNGMHPGMAMDASRHLMSQPPATNAINNAAHGKPGKHEFIQAFTHLLHTDVHFSDALYDSYAAIRARHMSPGPGVSQ